MSVINLREIRKDEYEKLYTNMKRDFPAGERPPYYAVRRNLDKRVYEAFFFMSAENDEIGYSVVTAPIGIDYALINFLAVLPDYRSKGYGGGILEALGSRYSERVIILEVEDPQGVAPELRDTAHARICFYERNGFRLLPDVTAKIFGVAMLLMTNSSKELEDVGEIMRSLYRPSFLSKRLLRFIQVTE